jgi:GAF domain-containing protein
MAWSAPLPVIDKVSMDGRPVLDEESFTRLLAAAYVVQEHQDRAREKLAIPPSDFTQIISRIVETQHLIQTRSLDAQAALDLIAGQMQKLSGSAGTAIGLLLDHVLHYKAGIGSASILVGLQIPEDVSISTRCLKRGEKLTSPLAEADPLIDQAFRRRVKAQSLIAVPIYHEGKIAGALEVYFSDVGAFSEADVRACELMAGLVTEVMAQAAEQELKQELAAERASVLLALQKLKPQLQKLAAEPSPSAARPLLRNAPSQVTKDTNRVTEQSSQAERERVRPGTSPEAEVTSEWARLWDQETGREETIEQLPVSPKTTPAKDLKAMAAAAPFNFQLPSDTDELVKTPVRNEAGVTSDVHSEVETSEELLEAEVTEGPPWSSAARTKNWFREHVQEKSWNIGDITLGVSAVVFLVVLIWGLWPQRKADPALNPQAKATVQGPAVRRRPKPKPPQLTLFERALVGLGLAEPPPAPQYMGNPDVKVWVDLQTALYYCPGTDLYGATPKGKYTSQQDAQQDQFEPAYRKPCD